MYSTLYSLASLLIQLLFLPIQFVLVLLSIVLWPIRRPTNRAPKNIIITGANSGLGEALALYYAKEGVTLGLTGRNSETLKKAAAACEAKGATVVQGVLDVSDAAAMEKWISDFDKKTPTDMVIANAGVSENSLGKGYDLASNTRDIFKTNVDGVFNTILPLVAPMKERKSGQIVLMSSLAGFGPLPSSAPYSASKAAIKTYGECIRGLLARDGVNVNVVCPGYVKSPMTDANKYKMPFLVSMDFAVKAITSGIRANLPVIAFPYQASLARLVDSSWLIPAVKDLFARNRWLPTIAYMGKRGGGGSKGSTESKSL
jgi:short-subunit dehydrogenase